MAKNVGKIFEGDFKDSVPEDCYLQRLNDSAQAFKKSNLARFTPKNPFDYLLFDCNHAILYCLELKSTKYKSMSFEDIYSEEKENKIIHKHQIIALTKNSKYKNVICGFLFNFRSEEFGSERTYFQNIIDFNAMCRKIDKSSFNEIDLIYNKAVKISGTKKRTHYSWDVDKFLKRNDINIYEE